MSNWIRWMVDPEVRRIDLEYQGTPFWIEVKQELTAGEAARLDAAGFMRGHHLLSGATDDQAVDVSVDWAMLTLMKVKTWLVAWSLTDERGASIPLTLDAIRALRAPVFRAIERAVDAHAQAVAEREKKASPPSFAKPSASGSG